MFRGRGDGRYRDRGNSSNRGGRGNSRQSTQPRGLFADGIWHCNCSPRLPAEHFKVKKEGKNQGRWFYTCQQGEPKRCDFFLWDEDAKPREEAAVLSNSRTEPRREGVQEGWNAGRARAADTEPPRKGLFSSNGRVTTGREDASTASPTPPPEYSTDPDGVNGTKRTAQDADLDDDFGLSGSEEEGLAKAADAASLQTPHKVQKTGVYATPATTGKRKLPWLELPTTPAAASKSTDDYPTTPSKQPANNGRPIIEPETPSAPPTLATAATPSPPKRHKDALTDPADSASSLTSEVLAALSSVSMPPQTLSNVRSILTRHDLKAQGVVKGRDISRLALKAKDAKIAELQARIASFEADREVERGLGRMKRWESAGGEG